MTSLLGLMLVSTMAACAPVEDEAYVGDEVDATEEAQEVQGENVDALAVADVGDEEQDARAPGEQDSSAIYAYCFNGWTAYNDCHAYGQAGRSQGRWSGYSCNYGNIYGGTCYGGYALYIW
ncbi:hypothetical protein [Chondromyces crocatus]|uniref:hypothetical protein n=1 Tax=Chondromyces crocatus TaxID=52 RepID=UPI0012E257B4|nr:hypothetical protein [Chondromyces crocatus]